jgi:long-chain fatty acid transport protein
MIRHAKALIGFFNTQVKQNSIAITQLIGLVALTTMPVGGEGFRNPPPGAFGLARAGGRIAQVDDASAVTHNPANLMDLKSPEAMVAPSFVAIMAEFSGPGGAYSKTRDPWKSLPAAYAAYPLPNQKLALGLGVNAPFGLSILYNPNTAFRYLAPYHSELRLVNLNPTLAARVRDNLTLGGGVDIFLSEVRLKQMYPWAIFPGGLPTDPDGELSARGKGVGLGANFGITWEFAPHHRLAATLRTPISVQYEGDFRVGNLSAAGAFVGGTPRSDFNTKFRFPTIVSVGYGVRVADKVRLEADVEWLQFSRFNTLPLGVGNNAVLLPSTTMLENWKDTFTVGVAGDWEFSPGWFVRGGYQFYKSPVPAHTLSPSIPDADQNVLTAGLAWKGKHHSLAFSYAAVFYDSRNISNNLNPAYNGRWEMMVHILSVGYSYRF